MAMSKIKTNDQVIVLCGKSKGKIGTVLKINGDRALVEGVNIVKRHVKPNPNKGDQGGIIEKEAFIHISNIAILNPQSKKADRVGFKILDDGKKVRYFKSDKEVVDI